MAGKDRARHAFGKSDSIEAAKQANKIDAFDILFLDGDTDPKIGWLDSQGNTVIVESTAEVKGQVAELETELAAKADAEEVAAELATKVSSEEVDAKIDTVVTEKVETVVTEKVTEKVETVMTEKVDTVITEKVDTVVNEKVETLVTEKVTEKVETTVVQALAKTDKYEILDVPKGTLVDYNDKEIRICCPSNSEWAKQAVGTGGDANSYYMTFRTYAPNDDAVGYIEHLGDQADPEILTDIKTDENGRRYQPTWLSLAKYDEATDTWTYLGANSTSSKMVGWDYRIDWFNADGVMIASDSIRINLSNEDCHYAIEPYYVNSMVGEVDTKVEEKVEEIVETKVETIVETKVDAAMDEKVEGAVNSAKEYTDLKIAEIEDSYGIIEF